MLNQPVAFGGSRGRGPTRCAAAVLSFVCLLLGAAPVADAALCLQNSSAVTPETRVVLAIDDGTATGDADAIAALFPLRSSQGPLARCGVEVVRVSGVVGSGQMLEVLERFALLSVNADLAVVFYAGRSSARPTVRADARFSALPRFPEEQEHSLPFDRILPAIAGAKRQIVILDTFVPHVITEQVADNQFVAYAAEPGRPAHYRRGAVGLLPELPEPGETVGLLPEPGETVHQSAETPAGRVRGYFTEALLEHLGTPGQPLRDVFDRVGATVRERTGRLSGNDVQEPFFTSGWEEPYVLDLNRPSVFSSAAADALLAEVVDALPVSAPAADVVTPVEAKLDGALLEMVRGRRDGRDAGALSDGGRVAVEIVCESPDHVAAVREQVVAAGGAVTASFEDHLWAEVPLAAVERLAATPAVWTMALNRAVARPVARPAR